MKNKRYLSIALALISLNLMIFTNCSKVEFDKMDESVTSVGDGDPVLPPTQVIQNCQSALQSGKLLSVDREIVFEDSRVETGRANICEFDSGDNLSQKNNYLRARYTQGQVLSMPQGAVICGAEIETDEQSFKFDDMFYLTFNDYVLASSLDRSIDALESQSVQLQSTGKSVNLHRYDWLKVRDASFEGVNEQSNDYCLGESEGHASCSWPLSQKQGRIKLQFDPELLIHIGLRQGNGPQRFGFVITGDNDPNLDCYHERLAFKTKVYYYVQ